MDFKSHGPRSSIFVTKDWVEQIVKSPTKWNSPKSHPNCPYGETGKIIGVFLYTPPQRPGDVTSYIAPHKEHIKRRRAPLARKETEPAGRSGEIIIKLAITWRWDDGNLCLSVAPHQKYEFVILKRIKYVKESNFFESPFIYGLEEVSFQRLPLVNYAKIQVPLTTPHAGPKPQTPSVAGSSPPPAAAPSARPPPIVGANEGVRTPASSVGPSLTLANVGGGDGTGVLAARGSGAGQDVADSGGAHRPYLGGEEGPETAGPGKTSSRAPEVGAERPQEMTNPIITISDIETADTYTLSTEQYSNDLIGHEDMSRISRELNTKSSRASYPSYRTSSKKITPARGQEMQPPLASENRYKMEPEQRRLMKAKQIRGFSCPGCRWRT